MSEMTPEQKRLYRKQEFKRKYARYWLVYLALIGTGILSAISGVLLPLQSDGVKITFFTFLAGLYYAVGFLSNGEGATYFWFDKLVDHDKDNTTQQIIAGTMLAIAIATVLTTALASASFIAYAMGAFDKFQTVPAWAQEWIVKAIPIFWVLHFSSGILFRVLSDEAASERDANSIIRGIQLQITKDKANARAEYWKTHAPDMARQLGELEAADEIGQMSLKLQNRASSRQNPTLARRFVDETGNSTHAEPESAPDSPNARRGG